MTTDSPKTLEQQTPVESVKSKAVLAEPAAETSTPAAVPKDAETTTDVEVAEKQPTEEELRALEILPDLKDQGTRAYATENYTEAVEKFSLASELLSKAYGPLSPKCADVLLMYGRALYRHAVSQSSPLGEKVVTEVSDKTDAAVSMPAESAEAIAAAEKEKAGTFVFEGEPVTTEAAESEVEEEDAGEEEAEDAEEGTAEGQAEESKDDMEMAWEALDVARVIYSKMTGEEAILQLAETYMVLGGVSLESESFAQAVKDFTSGLEILIKALPETNRKIAQAHYQLANAFEFTSESAKAIEHVQAAIDVLKKRIEMLNSTDAAELKGKGNASEADDVSYDKEAEIKEMQELIPEMERKIEDIKNAPAKTSDDKTDELMDECLGDKRLSTTVNDLSALVKSKKGDAAKFIEEALSKKAASGSGTAAEESQEEGQQGTKRKAEEEAPAPSEEIKKLKE